MNTITKIFVVLLMIFSVAFTMMTLQFAARTHRWRDLTNEYRDQLQATDTHLRNVLAGKVADQQSAFDKINNLTRRNKELERQVQELQSELNDVRVQLAQERANSSGLLAANRQLTGELAIAQNAWQEANNQRTDLEKRNVELEKRNIDLSERVNELTAQTIVLTQQTRQQEQTINIQKSELEKVMRQIGKGIVELPQPVGPEAGTVRAKTARTGPPIRGRVSAIEGNIASVSVGSADGVEPGMVFVIHRNGIYLGEMVVDEVAPRSAAGTLQIVKGNIREGDMVTDAERLGRDG